ncbi:glycosyltransferase [Acidipila sp. EB88]|uniref:glycosyltransferase n=1 Tax=Acidipila sp. EB88 TaxID=2305226 RepID=UPI000F5FFFE4|nr:glycosyltransferase [Acidipila sp. EB88]RRA48241.1 glycosyltransferase [Acidipila sp. EB88]
MKTALIFTNNVLPATQTFIQAQTSHLERYLPRHIGLAPYSPSLPVHPAPILLTKDRSAQSRFRKEIYKLTGVAPAFHREAQAVKASVLHSHFAEDAGLALPLQRATRLPLVVTLHGGIETQPDQKLRRELRGLEFLAHRAELQKRAAVFLCVSDFIRRKALAGGFPAAKCRVHYIGVDLDFFVPSAEPRERDVVLFVGRFVEKKGIAYLLRAMRIVQTTRPQTRLVLLGDGPLMGSLRALQQQLGVECEFHGSQPAPVVKQWLQRSRVVCAPSVTGQDGLSEGLPTVLVEAHAVGTPVVSTFHAGIPEIVQDGRTGVLVPEKDEAGLAKALLLYLGDDAAWSSASAAAVEWVRASFDLRRQNAELESVYDAASGTGYPAM